MLYVAIRYVSISYEDEGRTAKKFLCCMLQFVVSRYVMRVKEELLTVLPSPS